MTQTATITGNKSNARNLGGDKETIATAKLIAYADGKFVTVVDARWYQARSGDGSKPVYCSVWIGGHPASPSGYGRANGYGYHKASAALSSALDSAGVTLSERIDGVGDSAIRDALVAIGHACGYSISTVVES